MVHALITGGAGFVGSHLAEELLRQGYRVTVIDDLSTGRHENISHLEYDTNFRLFVDTILNETLLDSLIQEADMVFHLASAVGVGLVIDKPVYTIEAIVKGTDQVLRLARRYRRPVLLTSTSEVYGKGTKFPFCESDDTVLGPTVTRRWAYACGKMLDEFLALAHWHETKLPVVCVRLFNTVGPRQRGHYGMVLPRFVEAALTGEPLRVHGDGEQSRCFCHVSDVVRALVQLMECRKARGKIVNIGADTEVSIGALAARVCQLTGSSSRISHIPYRKAYVEGFEDMRRRVPDLSLAGALIDYAPTYSLDDIIHSVVKWAAGDEHVAKSAYELRAVA